MVLEGCFSLALTIMSDSLKKDSIESKHAAREVVKTVTDPAPTISDPSSTFSKREKWLIVVFTAFVGLFRSVIGL